jgi:hypothetical protein
MSVFGWMRRFVGSSLMALIASSVLFSSTSLGASDAVHKASATHSALKGLCTKKALQSYAPVGLVIKKIPDLNPSISAVVKTTDGVTYVPAGFFGDGAPEYCVVTGSIVTNSSTGKSANFGVALPAPGAWRQRLLMQGCGGNCGDVFDSGPPAPTLIQRGYAVWTTDDGHVDSGYAVAGQPALADSRWALAAAGRPNADAVLDYAYRAVHTVAQAGRVFTARLYGGQKIDRAYFLGCSDGGREAIQEADLYPEDFDGIVAGAPFLDPPASVLAGIATQIAQLRSPRSAVPAALFDVVSKAILGKCDATDGVTDGLVQNPAACAFDPQVDIPKCDGSRDGGSCLTQQQIDAVTVMLSAVRNEAGRVVGPGIATVSTGRADGGGGLASWAAFPLPPKSLSGPNPFGSDSVTAGFFWAWPLSDGFIRNFAFYGDPNYDSLTTLGMRFVENGEIKEIASSSVVPDEMANRIRQSMQEIGPANPYLLASFIERNRKLIMWHGFSDGWLSPYVTIRYYRELVRLHMGYQQLQKNVRLFMAPDVGHCGWGGEGPNAFQTLYHKMPGEPLPPPKMDAEHDLLMALEAWVEDNSAPQHIIASRYQDDDPRKPVVRAIPLCPFPAQAHYKGSGDVNEASSWSCPVGDQSLLVVGSSGIRGGL